LEENQIEVIAENSFSHLTRLKQLSLNKNKLKSI
jgi:Leucine-rich repeat (LRR) protein